MTIWKYPIHMGHNEHQLPKDAKAIAARHQIGRLKLWVMLDPDKPRCRRVFYCAITGEPLPEEYKPEQYVHIDTLETAHGELVHIFEIVDLLPIINVVNP